MASPQFEFLFGRCDREHMDIARGVLIERHRFKQDVLRILGRLLNVNQTEQIILAFENVGVALLTDLALKFFPVVAGHVLAILFHVTLGA